MVGLAFAIAASANFPALLMSIYWRGYTTWGAVTSIVVGATSALVLISISPTVMVDVLGHDSAIIGLTNPALISMPLAFACRDPRLAAPAGAGGSRSLRGGGAADPPRRDRTRAARRPAGPRPLKPHSGRPRRRAPRPRGTRRGKKPDMSDQTIETIFTEDRRYPPPPEFAAQAVAQPDVYERDFDEFWESEGRERVTWFEPFTEALRVGASLREVVSRREAQRLVQLRRPARRRRPRRPRRLPLGGRAGGRPARAHLRPAPGRRSSASRMRSRSSASARGRRSRSTWAWSRSSRSRCSPARGSARRTPSSSAASPPTRSPTARTTWAARC